MSHKEPPEETKICAQCGKYFEREESNANWDDFFCSIDCEGQFIFTRI